MIKGLNYYGIWKGQFIAITQKKKIKKKIAHMAETRDKVNKRNHPDTQPNVKQNRHHDSYLSEGCLVSLLHYKQ